MKLNEELFEDDVTYCITGYLNPTLRGIVESDITDDLEDAFEIAWEDIGKGLYTEIVNQITGASVVYDPDDPALGIEWEGEFPSEDRELLMKESMNRKNKKALKEDIVRDIEYFKDFEDIIGKPILFKVDIRYGNIDDFDEDINEFYFEDMGLTVSDNGDIIIPRGTVAKIVDCKKGKIPWAQTLVLRFNDYSDDLDFSVMGVKKDEVFVIMNESLKSRKSKKALKESLPREKRGKFFTAISRAIQGVLIDFGLDEEAILHPELAPSKEDIELALEVFKKNYFKHFYIDESLKEEKDSKKSKDAWEIQKDIEDFVNSYKSKHSKEEMRKQLMSFVDKVVNSSYKSIKEDLEPEAIDEPEKAEITWVDEKGEQKVSTVELIDKSFPKTAFKFSQEHNDCSIISCTAPLKGAQKEDEPKEVPLTESEEMDGLANLISNEINGEFETTNGYRNLRQVASEVSPDMLPVIDDIIDEENTHVGQLQTLLSMADDSADNIEVGAEEAEEQIDDEDEEEIEHNDDVDIDFAEIKKSNEDDDDLEVKDDFDFDDEPFDEEE